MKKYCITVVCLLFYISSYTQVIIGESNQTHDGVILQIDSETKGVLFPVVALTNRNLISPLTGIVPTGTLVYNTNAFGSFPNEVTPGFFWWNAEHREWTPIATNFENFSAKFSNNFFMQPTEGSLDDYYQGSKINMKIFGNTLFNERPDILELVNDKSIRFNYAGLYSVSVVLTLNKYNFYPAIAIRTSLALDNVQVGSSHYIRSSAAVTSTTGRFFTGSFTEYIEVKEGQVLTLQSIRGTLQNPTTFVVGFDSPASSSITISRIR